VNLDECLPSELRGSTIARVAAGMSGAGVYRVGDAHVLKVSSEPIEAWRHKLAIMRAAADAGLAPRVVHVDEEHRAIVSAYVTDRGLMPRLFDPQTRTAMIALFGRTLRRLHDLPVPDGPGADALALLRASAAACAASPRFVTDAVQRILDVPAPPARALVLSHNDVNPSNVVYDGERVLLLDWDVAMPNEPYYDLAAIATFLRLDETACLDLVAAHDGERPAALPARFVYDRRPVSRAVRGRSTTR
jgi:aminoglycoside phosphotransferase (APT) family kinase protein